MNYDQLNELLKSQSAANKRNFDDLLQALNKRKLFIIFSFAMIFLCGFIYMRYTPPTYESSVLLKKEAIKAETYRDDPYRRFVALQSQDDISTDIFLVTTKNVLDKVVNNLEMNFKIDRLVTSNNENEKIEKMLPSYNLWLENNYQNNGRYPMILNANIDSLSKTTRYFIKSKVNGQFDLYKTNEKTNTYVSSFPASSLMEINTGDFQINFYWPNVQAGTKLYFTVYDGLTSFNLLKQRISVSQKETTNLIEITVKDANPKTAQLIARTLVNKFNEARTEQQRENIQSSFVLIDTQLNEISKKLKKAEDNLSAYQSINGITKLDRSSDEI
ncbi:MAG: Wzz/FepE/Etk N-terminal domain-containing protein, partial [Bacteroidetes bacterium]|nr:Wzz/FepE/Etk N-terminal domain-containing protein [Bacteroidota bacterium]